MTNTHPADLKPLAIINHHTFIGIDQLKRVDSVELNVDTHPKVRKALHVGDLSRPLARLRGDTVDIDGNPTGTIRGWQTYVYADEPLEVVRELPWPEACPFCGSDDLSLWAIDGESDEANHGECSDR
jgi:hypothetical protein